MKNTNNDSIPMDNSNLAFKLNDTEKDRTVCGTIVKNAIDSGGVKYARIPLCLLKLAGYQRVELRTVRRISDEWDETRCGAILASHRDGSFWIVDGQHRTAAANLNGAEDIFAMILTGLTYEQEAMRFATQNRNVKPLSSYETLVGLREGGDYSAADIFSVCDECNVKVQRGPRAYAGILTCMGTVASVYKRNGRSGLKWVFDTIKKLQWDTVRNGYSSIVLNALSNMYFKHSDDAEGAQRRIANTCGKRPPDEVITVARKEYRGYGSTMALTSHWEAIMPYKK